MANFLKNSLYLLVIYMVAMGLMWSPIAYADVVSPKKQINIGTNPEKVICKENLFKIILKSGNRTLCVKPATAITLIERGVTKSTDSNAAKKFMEALTTTTNIGQVKKIAVLGIDAGSKIFRSDPPKIAYKVLFEVCANDLPIISPEVIISSQSATSFVKLAEDLPANTCEINAGTVAAKYPETIEVTLVNKGGVSNKISQLESKVAELKLKLEDEKAKLDARTKEGNIAKQQERISSIVQIRIELNDAREELNRYLFALHATPQLKIQDISVPKSFSGAPIEGVVVNKLAANKQLSGDGFDVAFEMCASSQIVRLPLVTVNSDLESKVVKLADKIIPNTCQVTGAKIMATSADDIQVSIGDTSEKSSIASQLEAKIADLTKSLQAEKLALKNLTHNPSRPANFDEQATNIANKISDLRNEINLAKVQLYSLLNNIYG